MKKFLKLLSLLLISTFLVFPLKASAHTHGGYSHDSSVNLDKSNWMSGLSDDIRINEISIPGTGNSMSYGNYTDFTLTQSMNLETQLNSGIRFLDLSLNHTGDTNLRVFTGITDLGINFTDVVDIVRKFLDKHQEEFVIIKVSENSSESGNFAYAVQRSIEDKGLDEYIFDASNNTNPKLKDVRGKIVILSDYDGKKWRTIPYRQNMVIQDDNTLNTNWDLYSKWEKVKAHLSSTNSNHNSNKMYINYLTGNGGSFPYFVASGHSSSGTGASRLATGLTEPGFKGYYPDFPRVNKFGIFSTIAFEGTNELTFSYILNNDVDFTGIIVADFPGAGLIREIIELNFKDSTSSSGGSNSGSSNNSGNNSSTPNKDGWGFTFKSKK